MGSNVGGTSACTRHEHYELIKESAGLPNEILPNDSMICYAYAYRPTPLTYVGLQNSTADPPAPEKAVLASCLPSSGAEPLIMEVCRPSRRLLHHN